MKHVKLGLCILAVLFALGLLLTSCLSGLRRELCGAMNTAATAALEERWEEADEAAGAGHRLWEQRRKFVASVVDHELLEEADTLFAQLDVYGALQLAAEYTTVCKCLVRQMDAIGESQSLRWWHLL
jgi:hypothetical protein